MERARRTVPARILFGLVLLIPAAAAGCKTRPESLVPIDDIQITSQRTNTQGYDFLAYLYLHVTGASPPPPDSCDAVDVYLAWKTADFSAPISVFTGPPFPSGYVWKRWRNVQRNAASACSWSDGVDFKRRIGSVSPRVVWTKITPVDNPNHTIKDDQMQD